MVSPEEADMGAETQTGETGGDIARKVDAVGWGVFFVWIGAVLQQDISAGWTLTVIGLIMMGVQIARIGFGLKLEGFWILVAGCFLVGGVGQMVKAQIHFVPFFLIVAGIVVILTTLWPARWRRKHA
jgi:hypothetical protein